MTVEVAVVVWVKMGVAAKLSCEHPACQRHTRHDSDLSPTSGCKELFCGFETEHIEDNLNALDIRIGYRLEGLIYSLYTDAVKTHLTLLHQVIEGTKNFWHIVDLCWRTVELEKIERFHLQVLQTAFDKTRQILAIVARSDMRVEPSTGFGCDDYLLASCFAYLSN